VCGVFVNMCSLFIFPLVVMVMLCNSCAGPGSR
jgi:hypothetical protein